jgi:cytochrome c-type biogenesis protein CcmH/NrfG
MSTNEAVRSVGDVDAGAAFTIQEVGTAPTARGTVESKYVFAMAVLCMIVGLPIGYLLRGSSSSASSAQAASSAGQPSTAAKPAAGGNATSMAELKQIADNQTAPLIQKLKGSPNDTALLSQIAAIYYTTHQFAEADTFYRRELAIDPTDVAVRNKLASSLYYGGDIDGAIDQLNQALTQDSGDANTLFNLGVIKLHGKQDGKGALAAWRQLLKANPQLAPERKATVLKQMAAAQSMMSDQRTLHGVRSSE